MVDSFTNKDIAMSLMEKGFNEPCIAFFDYEGELTTFDQHPENKITSYCNSEVREEVKPLVPFNQQVIQWFIDKHNIFISIDAVGTNVFMFAVWNTAAKQHLHDESEIFQSYKDCMQEAIKTSLKLI